MNLTIHHVENLTLYFTGGGSAPSSSSASLPAEPQADTTERLVPANLALLRARIAPVCKTCGGKKHIERNDLNEVGAQEYAPCPVCNRKRRDSDG